MPATKMLERHQAEQDAGPVPTGRWRICAAGTIRIALFGRFVGWFPLPEKIA